MQKLIISITFILFLNSCGKTNTVVYEYIDNNKTQETIVRSDDSNKSNEQNSTVEQNTTVEILPNKQIFLIGDSTVAILKDYNNTYNGKVYETSKVGWGHKLGSYMVNSENFHNVAEGGASSRSYKWIDGNSNHWGKTKQLITLNSHKNNDTYLLICLGLNDIGRGETESLKKIDAEDNNTKSTMPGTKNTFYRELKAYITYSKLNHITPVLLTPVQSLNKDKYNVKYKTDMRDVFKRDYGDYAQTIRDLAKDENILLLDLSKKSYDVFNAYTDPKKLLNDFSGGYDEDSFDGNMEPERDRVHLSANGANKVASWVVELACKSNDKVLCAQFIETNSSH
jgi:lysophospholipase L1-like esterase